MLRQFKALRSGSDLGSNQFHLLVILMRHFDSFLCGFLVLLGHAHVDVIVSFCCCGVLSWYVYWSGRRELFVRRKDNGLGSLHSHGNNTKRREREGLGAVWHFGPPTQSKTQHRSNKEEGAGEVREPRSFSVQIQKRNKGQKIEANTNKNKNTCSSQITINFAWC